MIAVKQNLWCYAFFGRSFLRPYLAVGCGVIAKHRLFPKQSSYWIVMEENRTATTHLQIHTHTPASEHAARQTDTHRKRILAKDPLRQSIVPRSDHYIVFAL